MFHLRRDRIVADPLRHSGIVFECALENKARRKATVVSQEFELWFAKDANDPSPEFITPLSFDLFSTPTDSPTFEPDVARVLKLIWHFTATQLQRIEDLRRGKEPWFQIRGRMSIQVQFLRNDAFTPHGEAYFAEESPLDPHSHSYPMRFKIDHEQWARLLVDVGFSHIFLQEITIPRFPPELKRAQERLTDAWNHHRAGRERPALQSCFNAFECLGFDVAGKPDAMRSDVLARLMDGEAREKQRKIKALWKALGEYCHLGRHDRGQPVHVGHKDGELAMVSATMLLRYLAESRQDRAGSDTA